MEGWRDGGGRNEPKSQKAIITDMSAPWNMLVRRTRERARDNGGAAGRRRRPEAEGDRFMVNVCIYFVVTMSVLRLHRARVRGTAYGAVSARAVEDGWRMIR
jgi:hypothetical protein